ncbi:MAG: glycosyltransferase family 2 protein [Methylobacter sp.]
MFSVIIITRNEASHIARCLESVSWVDEIIVLDSGSGDATVAICREYTDKVYETDWPGFGIQKQRALDKAGGEWVLSIDADEVVTPELRREIEQAIKLSGYNGFQIPRLSSYCGRQIRHGGWWPDYVLRLFRRNAGHFTDSVVHEQVIVQGQTGQLHSPLLHDAFINLDEVLHKVNCYSSLGAKMLYQRGVRSSLSKAIFKAFWTFIRTYWIKAAFLDGKQGLMLSISNAEGTYYKYVKLLELQNRQAP